MNYPIPFLGLPQNRIIIFVNLVNKGDTMVIYLTYIYINFIMYNITKICYLLLYLTHSATDVVGFEHQLSSIFTLSFDIPGSELRPGP